MTDDRERLLTFLVAKLSDLRLDLTSVTFEDNRDLVELPEDPANPGVPRHRKGREGELYVRVKYLVREGDG